MATIAVLTDGRLTGLKKVSKPRTTDVVVDDAIDLPLDGTYKWNTTEGCFVPIGHGFGKPKPCPVPDSLVLYQVAKAMKNPPQETRDWMRWYEANLRAAHEELVVGSSKLKRR